MASEQSNTNWPTIIVAIIGLVGSVAAAKITADAAGKEAGKQAGNQASNEAIGRLKNLGGIDVKDGIETVQAPDDTCSNWTLSNKTPGAKNITKHIAFSKPFTGKPAVFTSIQMMDVSHSENTRLLIYPNNISDDGFDLVIQTWSNSRVCGVSVQWLAFQK